MLSRLRDRKIGGTLLVEAAIMIPLVLVITFVLIEGGWLMLKAEQIENAARQGARKAALAGSVNADVTTVVDKIMTDAGLQGKYQTNIGVNGGTTGGNVGTATRGQTVLVNVKVAYSDISLTKVTSIFNYYGSSNNPPTFVGSTVTMTKE